MFFSYLGTKILFCIHIPKYKHYFYIPKPILLMIFLPKNEKK